MPRLPDRPHLDHVKKQAKDLLASYRQRDRAAIARIRDSLPVAARKDDEAIANLGLRLHDMQSCVAREYGFASWVDLKSFIEAHTLPAANRAARVLAWLRLVYPGHVAGGNNRARPSVAARILSDRPDLAGEDAYVACAIGNEAQLRRATRDDSSWVNRAGGSLELPPLVAVTHSSLLQLPAFGERLRACARVLLDAGADPNQSIGDRWPPASLEKPSEDYRLSALYGAAGSNHDPEMTELLLQAGADPNDGESLYHSLENLECTRLLLAADARVAGSNAMYRVLDLDNVDALRLLLAHGGNPNEPPLGELTAASGSPLLWAIRRRRSPAHVKALLDAGADPAATTPDGVSAYVWALRFGLSDVAALLPPTDVGGQIGDEEQFVAACARGDEAEARRIQARRADLPGALFEAQHRLLPELAAQGGANEVVKLMVRLGWPIAVTGGDWNASALNHAVFRGDAELTRFLLDHGASWQEQHGYGDNACGTLSWASRNEPVDGGDWLGCAAALLAHGMPAAQPDPSRPECVVINGHRRWFSDEVADFLLEEGAPSP